MVIEVLPRVLEEVISVTPAIWPSCRSRGVATDDAIISALAPGKPRSEEHTSELQSLRHLVCRLPPPNAPLFPYTTLFRSISVPPAIWPSCRSRGVATDDAIISALAPGKPELTETVGKSTSEIGRAHV